MTIELNGQAVELTQPASIGDAVERAGADPQRRGIAVAVDGEVVPRSAWDATRLREGQRVEVVGAIQGG
jgi:sulfur carrier protein